MDNKIFVMRKFESSLMLIPSFVSQYNFQVSKEEGSMGTTDTKRSSTQDNKNGLCRGWEKPENGGKCRFPFDGRLVKGTKCDCFMNVKL